MNHGFGSERPSAHRQRALRRTSRYLVLIDSGGMGLARLFDDERVQTAEYDAGATEVAWLCAGERPVLGAQGSEWNRALEGHSPLERANAEVYALDA